MAGKCRFLIAWPPGDKWDWLNLFLVVGRRSVRRHAAYHLLLALASAIRLSGQSVITHHLPLPSPLSDPGTLPDSSFWSSCMH